MTIFEKIVKGEIPSHKVWEDEDHLAFLDIRPVAPGHTLVIPKQPADPIFNLDSSAYQKLFSVAKTVADLLKTRLLCDRVCMAVIGFEVPHAHIHLIPARSMRDFPWPGGQVANPDELNAILAKIRGPM
jgi:histidine triad (HIT) family protein